MLRYSRTSKGKTREMNPSDNNPKGSNKEQTLGLIVCGPCACGKSEVASALASHFQVPFIDADTLHSESNIQKMSAGIPLTDQDRFPWLQQVRKELIANQRQHLSKEGGIPPVAIVGACSALKRKYRDILSGVDAENANIKIIFVFLNCSEEVLQKRLNARQGHFMKANMLSSQLAALELPQESTEGSSAIVVDGGKDLCHVVAESTSKLEKLCNY